MQIKNIIIYIFFLIYTLSSCASNIHSMGSVLNDSTKIETGADQIEKYIHLLRGKQIGLLVNHSSLVGDRHLLDTLLALGIKVNKIFAPEHGFRGDADAGAIIQDGKDLKTGISVISLYGSKKKPTSSDLSNIDIMVYDLQDVGVRFYTYISSLHYMMEACAEYGLPLIVLDRPNPNGHYIDGPILDPAFSSFVGMHPVPIVYGMTIGEYALMIKGESWINMASVLQLEVIRCNGYTHDTHYTLPVKPSPNLPNARSIALYPSLCLFEGTDISVGRGTDKQFQIIGHPSLKGVMADSFYVASLPGAIKPPHLGKMCYGRDFSDLDVNTLHREKSLNLKPLLQMFEAMGSSEDFFLPNQFFDKLAGTDELRHQILSGLNADAIKASWQPDLNKFRLTRSKYLLYEDE